MTIAKVTETQITKFLTAKWEGLGCEVIKIAGGMFQKSGLPDVQVYLPGYLRRNLGLDEKVLQIELKRFDGTYSDIQITRLKRFVALGVCAFGLRCLEPRVSDYRVGSYEMTIFEPDGNEIVVELPVQSVCDLTMIRDYWEMMNG